MRQFPFVALLSVALLAGAVTPAKASTDTIKKIRDAGAIILGYREAAIPFSYTDASGKPIGYAVDLCLRAIEQMKAKLGAPDFAVRWQPVTSANRVPLVTNGSVDLECGSTSNTLERQKRVAFGPTYFVSRIAIAVKADSTFTDLASAGHRPIAVTAGTTSVLAIKRFEEARGLNLNDFTLRDHQQTFNALASGRAEAVVLDHVLLAGFIAASEAPEAYRLVDEDLGAEGYGAMFRKGDPAFAKLVSEAFAAVMTSGEAEKLYAKWFMSPTPPKSMNLGIPLPPGLRRLFAEPSSKPL